MLDNKDSWQFEYSLEELSRLAETAGAEVQGQVVQRRKSPHPAYYVGRGKAQELARLVQETGVDLVIFYDELSPSQARNLEKVLEVKVLDRTALILDIFAQRARTREGKLQVELAQLDYLLPRLTGYGGVLSRLGGGIGTRGPGETKLEVDRRVIRQRIRELNQEIRDLKKHRAIQRKTRQKVPYPVASLVGYTNAGKSTLLNSLTDSRVFTQDKLFATLDPTTRKVLLPDRQLLLITDTVGFIQDLPPNLGAAFRATLEEVQEADIILHVVDVSHGHREEQLQAVQKILEDLEVTGKPTLFVFNKVDLLEDSSALKRLSMGYPQSVPVSAREKINLDRLLEEIALLLRENWKRVTLEIPLEDGRALAFVHQKGKVIKAEHHPGGHRLEVEIEERWLKRLQGFLRTEGRGP